MIKHKITYKTSAVEPSEFTLSVSLADRHVQLLHFVGKFEDLLRDGQTCPGIIGYIAFISGEKKLVQETAKGIDVWVRHRGLSYIIDLNAFILAARISEKKDPVQDYLFRGDVHKFAFGSTPNGVEFGFYNHGLRPFPDSPPDYLFATVSNRMLWNDPETFIGFLVRRGLDRNIKRMLAGGDIVTKAQEKGRDG